MRPWRRADFVKQMGISTPEFKYLTAISAGVRCLRLPFTQYSPALVPAASLIATFGFCAPRIADSQQ
jgi:hypothetical protein